MELLVGTGAAAIPALDDAYRKDNFPGNFGPLQDWLHTVIMAIWALETKVAGERGGCPAKSYRKRSRAAVERLAMLRQHAVSPFRRINLSLEMNSQDFCVSPVERLAMERKHLNIAASEERGEVP